MGGAHSNPSVSFRPPAEVRDGARIAVNDTGWTMQDVLTACLNALRTNPAWLLKALTPYRLKSAPAHRPRTRAR